MPLRCVEDVSADKMLTPTALIALAVAACSGAATNCDSPTGLCSWYVQCLQAKYPTCTGASNYAINFGKRFCDRYAETFDSFTAKGQAWVNRTRLCLQIALVPYIEDSLQITLAPYMEDSKHLSCKGLRETAFATHSPCYVNSGFCSLSFWDWLQVARTVAPALGVAFLETVSGFVQSLTHCLLSPQVT